jgi:hypothetical protein
MVDFEMLRLDTRYSRFASSDIFVAVRNWEKGICQDLSNSQVPSRQS